MPIFGSKRNCDGSRVCGCVSSGFKQKTCMWFDPINEATYIHVLCRSTSTIIVKAPVISSEPTTVTGTTRDRPGEREFCLLLIFSSEKGPPPYEGTKGLFYSARDLPLHGNVHPIRIPSQFMGD